MANDNKISLDLDINDRSVETAWGIVDERGTKSAKASAVAFEQAFQASEQTLKASIQKLTNESKEYVSKSAKESAVVFQQAFERQNQIYKASVKQNIDNALNSLTNASGVRKSAAESASVFEDAFKKEASGFAPVSIPVSTGAGGFKALQSLADINAALLLVKAGADVVKKAFSEALDSVLEGEKIKKIETRFEALATQVGIVSDSLRVNLKASLNGLVDDTEALSFASEAFVKLGNAAKDLPKVIEASRKSYQVFGGDILSNAGKIINAAETGSARTLRDIGLYTNLEAAVKKYAKAQGTIPALLTDTQKEQARLNAILAEADIRFAGVQAKAGSISAYTQLKVAIKDLSDEFLKIADTKLGKVFQGLAEGATAAINSISEAVKRSQPATTVEEIGKRIDTLRARQAAYAAELASSGTGVNAFTSNLKGQLATLKDQIASYEEIRRKLGQVAATKFQDAKDKRPRDSSADEELVRRRAAAAAKITEIDRTLQASQVLIAQDEFARKANAANLDNVYAAQKLQAQTTYQLQSAELQKTFLDNGTFTEAQKQQADEALFQTHVNNKLKIQRDYEAQRVSLAKSEIEGFISISEGANLALARMATGFGTFKDVMKASLKDVGKAFTQTFKQQATGAIFAFAQGSKNASEAAQGLFTGILNAMGEMLISQGLGFILQGAAFTYAGLPNGPALAAAGLGMVALGGVLAAVSAANGGKVGASGGGGGSAGVTESYTPNNGPTTPIVDTKPENPNTQINVNVGQVFDRRETGMWITDILTENFEQNGVTVRSNV